MKLDWLNLDHLQKSIPHLFFFRSNAITIKNERIPNHIKVLKQFCKLLKIKKMRRILLFTLCINLISSVYAQKEDKRKTIDSLTTEMTISEGLINTYSNEENKLYFVITEVLSDTVNM